MFLDLRDNKNGSLSTDVCNFWMIQRNTAHFPSTCIMYELYMQSYCCHWRYVLQTTSCWYLKHSPLPSSSSQNWLLQKNRIPNNQCLRWPMTEPTTLRISHNLLHSPLWMWCANANISTHLIARTHTQTYTRLHTRILTHMYLHLDMYTSPSLVSMNLSPRLYPRSTPLQLHQQRCEYVMLASTCVFHDKNTGVHTLIHKCKNMHTYAYTHFLACTHI